MSCELEKYFKYHLWGTRLRKGCCKIIRYENVEKISNTITAGM